jgi:hypothetical protein
MSRDLSYRNKSDLHRPADRTSHPNHSGLLFYHGELYTVATPVRFSAILSPPTLIVLFLLSHDIENGLSRRTELNRGALFSAGKSFQEDKKRVGSDFGFSVGCVLESAE